MANRQEELVYAMEELTGTMKRQSSITETMGQAIQGAMMSSENLKAAMLKTGRFNESKMLGAIEKMSDMPGRIDKVIQGFGQYLQAGLGSHTDKFIGVISKISALGLDNGPFLQLARSMNAKMGMSIDQRDQHFKELLNLREVTGQNPELMAKALAQQSQTFSEAAGIWGPGFSEKLMNSMKVMAKGRGGDEMVGQMMNMMKPLLEAGPEGMAKRAALNQGRGPKLSANMSQEDMMQFILTSMQSMGSNPAFQSALTRQVTGSGLLGFGGNEFQTAQQMNKRLRGETSGSLMGDLGKIQGDALGEGTVGAGAGKSQSANQLLSVKMNNVLNKFADVLPEAITVVMKSLDGLADSAATLAGTLAGHMKGGALGLAGMLAGGIGKGRSGGAGIMGSIMESYSGGALGDVAGGGTKMAKGSWEMLSNSVMLLVKAFTEGGALGALGLIITGFWNYLAAAIPHFIKGSAQMLKAEVDYWAAMAAAQFEYLVSAAYAWADYFAGLFKLNMDMLWADISRSSYLIGDTTLTSEAMEEASLVGLGKTKDSLMADAGRKRGRANDSAAESYDVTSEYGILGRGDTTDMRLSKEDMQDGWDQLKAAFNEGPQATRLKEIEAGFKEFKVGFNEVKEVVLEHLPTLSK